MKNTLSPPPVFYLIRLLLALCLGSSSASAAVLVSYTFSTASPDTPATHMLAGNAAWTGYAAAPASGFSSATSTAFARTDVVAAALDLGRYLELTISADMGYVLDLSEVSFVFGGNANSGTSITSSTELRTNAEAVDYTTSLALTKVSGSGSVTGGGMVAEQTYTGSSNTMSTFSADLSGSIYQVASTVTFRWYVYDTSSSNSFFNRFDSVVISGSVWAVPEPASASWVLLAAMIGLVAPRKRVMWRCL